MPEKPHRPVILLVLDGWGIAPPSSGNPIAMTPTPSVNTLLTKYPTVTLSASGEAVGLPYGEMGNSEVGHLTMGIGRVYDQSFLRITKSIWNKTFFSNPVLRDCMRQIKERGSTLHLIGLTSAGGVHAYIEHLYALLELAAHEGLHSVAVHAILDGRDTAFNIGINFIARLEERLHLFGFGSIASISGRSWAMDKNARWERIEKAYRAIVEGESDEFFTSAQHAILSSYNRGVYDEDFVPLALRKEGTADPVARVHDGDGVIFFNFRPDRARELTTAFVLPSFNKFPRRAIKDLLFVTMTQYDETLPTTVAFPTEPITTWLSLVVSQAGVRQVHIAETEKYAHVTYFFNGLNQTASPGEEHVIVPSPRVSSYDEEPEMSSDEVTRRLVEAIRSGTYGFLLANLATVDMVAHTGNFEATQRAIAAIDRCIGQIADAAKLVDAILIITADHGNGEDMIDPMTGLRTTTHSSNPVFCILVNRAWYGRGGVEDISGVPPTYGLSVIAPTVLDCLGIPLPIAMNGKSLLQELHLQESL